MYSGRSGLENTSFALMDPNGKKITRGARSPKMLYSTAAAFAAALVETSSKYAEARDLRALPTLRDLRLALNVSAADMRPLVIVRGKDAKSAEKLGERVAELAWSSDFIGRAHYVILDEETAFEGLTPPLGVSLVQPNPYGLGGSILEEVSATASAKVLQAGLAKVLGAYAVDARTHSEHVREARRKGIDWESEIPVTDTRKTRRR